MGRSTKMAAAAAVALAALSCPRRAHACNGVNWVGVAHPRPWYPSVLGAVKLSLLEAVIPVGEAPQSGGVPNELLFGLGVAGVATGELVNEDSSRGNGLSFGFLLHASFTPANM